MNFRMFPGEKGSLMNAKMIKWSLQSTPPLPQKLSQFIPCHCLPKGHIRCIRVAASRSEKNRPHQRHQHILELIRLSLALSPDTQMWALLL